MTDIPAGSSAIRIESGQRHLRMVVDTICAVDGISLDFAPGAFVARLGSSGSGKRAARLDPAQAWRNE
ncbi:MAG: hypothetical protein ABSF45_23770 [Terriglobia bacterium]|jgi:ABC-type Fe3+/spermidine/putrescine transport system ATPase subunit